MKVRFVPADWATALNDTVTSVNVPVGKLENVPAA